MKIVCKIDQGKPIKGFQPYRVIIEAPFGKLYELDVALGGWPTDNRPIQIKSDGVTLTIKTLIVDCSHISVPTLLLHLELCKFVLEQSPELLKFNYMEPAS